mmetsp:Transcript_1965/g.1613  ORF Transcript_1965/g.1613 Transcript_1965/m.1613 type:complete len:140 (-) Transcript_1965:269-688(-)
MVPMNDGAKQQAVSSTASQASSLKEEMKPKKDTWASRTFAPGSPFTATIAVIKATLGGAILSNTYMMAIGGYVSAITLLIFMAVLNVFSLDMIVRTEEIKCNNSKPEDTHDTHNGKISQRAKTLNQANRVHNNTQHNKR